MLPVSNICCHELALSCTCAYTEYLLYALDDADVYKLRLPLPMGVMKIYASRAPFVVMLSVDCLMNR